MPADVGSSKKLKDLQGTSSRGLLRPGGRVVGYRGTSLIRNLTLLGPYRSPCPRGAYSRTHEPTRHLRDGLRRRRVAGVRKDRIGTGPPRARTEVIYADGGCGLLRARSTQKGIADSGSAFTGATQLIHGHEVGAVGCGPEAGSSWPSWPRQGSYITSEFR